MKQYSWTILATVAIFVSAGLLTACGTIGTASTSDYDADMAVSTEIQDLGTEEYLIMEIDTAVTDEEKQMKMISYLQETLADNITNAYPSIKDTNVTLIVKDTNATLTGVGEVTQIKIYLDLEEELTEDSIVEIAEAAARAVDSVTDYVTIQDTDGNILYIRSEAFSRSGV